jgi:hypothetical protein
MKYRTFTMARIEEASEDQCGICLACGHTQECCEPDAREYRCDSCKRNQVYGAEELILMGRVKF